MGSWTHGGQDCGLSSIEEPSTVFLRMGTADMRGVHLNQVHPLLDDEDDDHMMPADRTPP